MTGASRRIRLVWGLLAVLALVSMRWVRTPPNGDAPAAAATDVRKGGDADVAHRSVEVREAGDGRLDEGMVFIPGGVARIGSKDGPPEERPVFTTEVQPFHLDVHPVTVAEFRRYVEATGRITDAERFGAGGVYDVRTGDWKLVKGATWRHPLGPQGSPAPNDHPVTQVSWYDASAYAEWAGKRLPTEIEWEYAARGATDRAGPYSWGPSLVEHGAHRANTWQGAFPGDNTLDDGFLYTSPVGAFGATPLGLTDMGGNVWQWTADWFHAYDQRGRPVIAGSGEKVQRGGSFLCHPDFCHGYRVSARSHSTPDTSLFHVGFRCARNAPQGSY